MSSSVPWGWINTVMDYLDGELQEGESYLLLSDGVWSCVPERDIAHILHDQPDLGAAAGRWSASRTRAAAGTTPAPCCYGWTRCPRRCSPIPWRSSITGRCHRSCAPGRPSRAGR